MGYSASVPNNWSAAAPRSSRVISENAVVKKPLRARRHSSLPRLVQSSSKVVGTRSALLRKSVMSPQPVSKAASASAIGFCRRRMARRRQPAGQMVEGRGRATARCGPARGGAQASAQSSRQSVRSRTPPPFPWHCTPQFRWRSTWGRETAEYRRSLSARTFPSAP